MRFVNYALYARGETVLVDRCLESAQCYRVIIIPNGFYNFLRNKQNYTLVLCYVLFTQFMYYLLFLFFVSPFHYVKLPSADEPGNLSTPFDTSNDFDLASIFFFLLQSLRQ